MAQAVASTFRDESVPDCRPRRTVDRGRVSRALAVTFGLAFVQACMTDLPPPSTVPSPSGAAPSLGSASTSQAPPATSPPSPSAARSIRTEVVLNVAPPDVECDAIVAPYASVVFRVGDAAPGEVIARANTGVDLKTFWPAGFSAAAGPPAAVKDASGAIVATDGEQLATPPRALPRLHGYLVCPGPQTIYVVPDRRG
jgi:hypothetical protein